MSLILSPGEEFYLRNERGTLHLLSNGPLTRRVQVLVHVEKHEPHKNLYVSYQYFKPIMKKFTYAYKVCSCQSCSEVQAKIRIIPKSSKERFHLVNSYNE